jgi:inhibitor of cysteine peptidase
MKSKMFIIGLLVILTLSLFACTSTAQEEEETSVEPGSSASYTCDDFTENSHITDNIEMRTDKTLTVTLCSNATTGFEWGEETQISDPTVLEQASHEYIAPGSQALGAAGMEKYTFTPLKAGTATITLEYGRPWEGGEKAEWTCTLNITVK